MKEMTKPGFTTKLLAFWINALFVFFVLKLFFYVCLVLPWYLYFPFVFTYIVTFIAYRIICICFKCKTVGRYLLSINIKKPFTNVIKYVTAISLLVAVVYYFGNIVYLWNDFKPMKLTSTVVHPFENREAPVTEFSALSEEEYSSLSNWIEHNRETPEDYVVKIAKNHKVTIIGERHENKDYLNFLNEIIPSLYYNAGVRCIAMECIPSSMNRKIEKLINAKDFNEKLFLKISRKSAWAAWGFEEYWNVLKTAWKLNNNLKPNEQKLRVVGIDSEWDGPSFALVFSDEIDGIPNVSLFEKFRAFTLLPDFIKLINRNEIMARNIEKEAFEKNDKCVVWIGHAHSYVNYGYGIFVHNQFLRCKNGMGVMLSQKYKDDMFQIVLHDYDFIPDEVSSKVIYEKELAPVGFTVENSPFAMLRDSTSYLFTNMPTVSLSDVAQGYIYIMPLDSTTHCSWVPDYVSKKMFLKYKPFYEGKLGQKFKNNKEVNDYFVTMCNLPY